MEIALFNNITTEDVLIAIEEDGKKYEGLYVDMDNAPERKYVKDNAAKITGIIKKLDRARIDMAKDYKTQVEKEFADIKERLEIANEPFTLLLDEYKEQRAKILAAEKERKDAEQLAILIESDHEIALLMNANYASEKAAAEQAKKEREEQIAKEASERAIEQEKIKQANIKQDEINAENARLANVEHVRTINRSIYTSFINAGVDAENAKLATQALIDGNITSTKINY